MYYWEELFFKLLTFYLDSDKPKNKNRKRDRGDDKCTAQGQEPGSHSMFTCRVKLIYS